MAQILRTESDTDHRYRITRTDRGILVSCAMKSQVGLLLGPAEWLYQTEEAAQKGLEVIMLMNAWGTAMMRGYPTGDIVERCEKAAAQHREIVERLNDEPLVGAEVKALREQVEGGWYCAAEAREHQAQISNMKRERHSIARKHATELFVTARSTAFTQI
jgi:hypothetical protein